ncbi:succinylglutamate desuccinylase/aspartoacylase family protein [uncultured Devosia sp.]|uniref:succinylglutamate desuccinylase/aspartoacylase family protein n=1 Tax=uncultured Devosia sp. TaxID=211434 RepID=UPI0035CC5952
MTFQQHQTVLTGDTPGASATLYSYTAGPPDAPVKVHLQAALHADEQPGTMALHHLLPMLRDADAADQLKARFVVFPSVNPLGLGNITLRRHNGRYDLGTGLNYNRRWPDLYPAIAADIAGKLTDDPAVNIATIRAAVAAFIAAQRPTSATQQLRLLILQSAHDADIMLDLHCDDDSLKHIFTSPELMPGLQDLADWFGSTATLTAQDSGGGSFDEVLPILYRQAQAANPDYPIPVAAQTATLEYRGQADVFDTTGRADAKGLFGFFAARGLIAADPGLRPASAPAPVPFDATEVVRVDAPGLLAYRVALGDRVTRGQPIADLIAMDGPGAFLARQPILAGTDGFILSRTALKYVKRGSNIAKIVGTEPLAARSGGYLLED